VKRHLLGIVAASLAIAMVVPGCGKGGSNSEGTKSIKFLGAEYGEKGESKAFWDVFKKEYESRNAGYTLNVEVVSWNDIDQKVKTLVSTKQQPDILNLNKFSDFARDGLLHKAADVVPAGVQGDFLPVFVEQSKYNGEQYGLPFISSARLFFYDKDVFAKAGLPGPPKTWDEVRSYAQQVKAKVPGVVPLGLPLGPEEAQAEFGMWAMNNGGSWKEGDKWTINSEKNVQTLSYLRDLTKAGLTQPNPATTDRKAVFNLFSQGKVGMLNGAVFMRDSFIKPAGNKVNFGVAPLPANAGAASSTWGVVDFLMAFDREGNTEAVKRFVELFYTKEQSGKFLTTHGFLPVTTSAGDVVGSDAYMKQFVEVLPSAKFAPTTDPAWQAVDGAVKQKLGSATAGKDPKAVLDDIQQTAEKKSQ
jgi:ABC-type glycerol-3-phosphate transport system substrate-binding protein